MAQHSAEMTRCIRELDIDGFMKLTKHVNPDVAPENRWQAEFQIHLARTGMRSMADKLRFYSHCWLRDAGFQKQSLLPDKLKPRAERMYPVGAQAVGVATRTRTDRAVAIRRVMENAILECQADGHSLADKVVHHRMMEMRQRFIRSE